MNSGYSKVMKDCASKPEYYFEITPGETVPAFASIGTSLTKLRLAEQRSNTNRDQSPA